MKKFKMKKMMRSTFGRLFNKNWVLAAILVCGASVFTSCSSNEDTPVPQPDINLAEKIVGKWMTAELDGKPCPTNLKTVVTFDSPTKAYGSLSDFYSKSWNNKVEADVKINGNKILITAKEDDNTTHVLDVTVSSITDTDMVLSSDWTVLVDGKEAYHEVYEEERWVRVTSDYAAAFLGTWEGKVTRDLGDETNDELHRWECMAAGNYTFYDLVDNKWVEVPHYLADYFVDGTLLCTRWQDTKNSEELREWWEIESIKDDVIKATALRVREDGSTYTATFQMTRVQPETVDYSDEDNWMYLSEATKDVDCFYVYPTEYVDDSEGAPIHAAIDDPAMRIPAMRTSLVQATAFEDVANVYAPFYRQCNMAALAKMSMEDREAAFNSVPKKDVFAALDYYFEHFNGGRPFILAGHSQGSIMQSFVLAEYMKAHPEYLKRMIAAYVIGFSITEDYLKDNPHLKFAEGADDTGVIISYNTEAAGNTNNIVVMPGAISINPINWKRDETYASAEESLGGYIFNEETGLPEDYPHAADAKIDLKRGVVITTTKAVAPETFPLFGPASFHENDYPLYYYNIKANAATRVAAYKNKAKQ